MHDQNVLSVVIPTLNEEENLLRLLPELLAFKPAPEIVVSDGGSIDKSLEIAQAFGVTFIAEAQGRGPQLNAGAARCTGEIFLFLHADCLLPAKSYHGLLQTMTVEPQLAGGAFTFSLGRTPGLWPRIYEMNVWLRSRIFNLPYGDQGFFIRRDVWFRGFHFQEQPLMEDVAWWQKMKRHEHVRVLPWPLITSARRFKQRGYLKSAIRNLWTLIRYRCGVSPVRLAKEYHR